MFTAKFRQVTGKTVDGKEVKGAYNKNGVSTQDAIDLSEDYE